MSHDPTRSAPSPSAAPVTPTNAASRRYGFLLAALALAVAAIAAVWTLLPETVDQGSKLMLSFLLVVALLVATAAWFFFLGRFAGRTRTIGAVLIALVVVPLFGSVRRVEFSGDMIPTFDMRWHADRNAALEAHRAQQAAEAKTGVADPQQAAESSHPGNWDVLEYRGVNRDGVVDGPRLARDWSASPPKLVWRQPVGGGYAGFVVQGPQVITIEQRRDREAIVSYDFDTGRERWVYDYPALFHETLGGDGPRATPTISDGKVYSLGATGVLACLDLNTGKELWSLNILQQNSAGNLQWAMAGSPLVYENRVLVNPGTQLSTGKSFAVTAFDAANGQPLWGGGETQGGYASPMWATLGGMRQILIFDGVGLAGYDPADARELWRTPWKSDFDINAAQPIVVDDQRVLITSAAGAALVRVAQADGRWTAEEIWRNRKLKGGYTCPIAYEGFVYGVDESILVCLEIETGKLRWKDRGGQYGHGQMLRSGDLLVVLAESGELALVELSSEKFHELGRIQAIEGKTWNNPTLVGGRIFVRNHLEMAAYDLPLAEPPAEQ